MESFSRSVCINFNPLPRKEGDATSQLLFGVVRDFNPLPRKEGDEAKDAVDDAEKSISIHSLVKRETGFCL